MLKLWKDENSDGSLSTTVILGFNKIHTMNSSSSVIELGKQQLNFKKFGKAFFFFFFLQLTIKSTKYQEIEVPSGNMLLY